MISTYSASECYDSLWFFFFKQKTAYEMRISDWSSDVCSSDLMGATGAIAVNPHRPGASPLKPEQDLTPVAKLANIPLVMIAGKSTGYASLKDLIQKAKQHPGEPLIYGTPGQYTAQHLSGELVGEMAGKIGRAHV